MPSLPCRRKHLYPSTVVVLDPFIGSGTTAVACKELNRNFIGFEINPDYHAASLKRLAAA